MSSYIAPERIVPTCKYWKPFKGRGAHAGQSVKVYRNLHHGGYSIVAADGEHAGLVVARSGHVVLMDALFVVSEAGRQRVIREKKKNVHAYALGTLTWALDPALAKHESDMPRFAAGDLTEISYNPYKMSSFYVRRQWESVNTVTPVHAAWLVHLTPIGCYGQIGEYENYG